MKTKLTTALLIGAAAVAVPLSAGVGTASAGITQVIEGPIPLQQCRDEAARLNEKYKGSPEDTRATYTNYRCYQNIALGGGSLGFVVADTGAI